MIAAVPWFIPHLGGYLVGYAALLSAAAVLLLRRNQEEPVAAGAAYRLGFPFLTVGLVAGGFWARGAWGDWWQWDPKETWALITWSLYAAVPLADTPRMRRALMLAGAVAILITFFAAGFLPFFKGRHSYAH